MMRSLFSGVAGLKTHQTKMDVIGNNIANVNTVAYKSQSVTFSDLMYQTTQNASGASESGKAGTNAKQIGLGVTTGAINTAITTQGASQSTGNPFDIQISGDEFFIVSNGVNNYFTRAGAFYVDGAGTLAMTSNGYTVMGWQEDPTNPGTIIKDTVSPLKIMSAENLTSEPEQTQKAYLSGIIDKNSTQLDSSEGLIMNLSIYDNLGYSYMVKTSITPIDKEAGTYSIVPTKILDSDGNDVLKDSAKEASETSTDNPKTGTSTVSVTLGGVKVTCKYTAAKPATGTDPAVPEKYEYIYSPEQNKYTTAADGTKTENTNYKPCVLRYDPEKGSYLGYTDPDGVAHGSDYILGLTVDGIDGFSVTTDKQTDASGVDIGGGNNVDVVLNTTTCYDNKGTSTIKGVAGDYNGQYAGRKVGEMSGVSIQTDGKIYGSYSNGTRKLLGQIAVASFANASGLQKEGENLYSSTLNSGAFDGIGVDISANGDGMSTGVLEMSNVDLASEFTDMITTQRGFQANSRIITVSDTMIEELTNLKR